MIGVIFTVRTTVGQEKLVSDVLEKKLRKEKEEVYSISVIDQLKGYIFVEAKDEGEVRKLIYGVNNVKGIIPTPLDFSELEKFFEEKPPSEELKRGDIVEITSGPFKGERAKVVRVDDTKEKVTVEIIDAVIPVPVTLSVASVRRIQEE